MTATPRFQTFRFWGILCCILVAGGWFGGGKAVAATPGEYIIVSGGPSLLEWEQYRRESHRHDKWWGNFIRTARVRMEQIQKAAPGTPITWLVYGPGYQSRAAEEGQPLLDNITSVRDKYGVNLVWFRTEDELINYINAGKDRRVTKVVGFEYFGHSNKYCFVFDYSNEVLGASKCFLHEDDLKRLDRNAFYRKAYCRSWGCHTGESFSAAFRRATGVKMIGAIGKTDYSKTYLLTLPTVSPEGRWVD